MRIFILVVLAGGAWAVSLSAARSQQPVNRVTGDQSWLHVHGSAPGNADEGERIATHLRWVRSELMASEMTASEPARQRLRLLDELGRYAERKIFPRHDGPIVGQRVPRFVDSDGTHCAVAHLMAFSGAERLVDEIQAHHEYDYVEDVDLMRGQRFQQQHFREQSDGLHRRRVQQLVADRR